MLVYCSSNFALRSYLYILLHQLVAGPASWIFGEDKVRFSYFFWNILASTVLLIVY